MPEGSVGMMDEKAGKILLIVIGNDGRGDDGVGWALGRMAEKWGAFPGIVEYRYQLQVEDALLVAGYEKVVFADACHAPLNNGFDLSSIGPSACIPFSTHRLEPSAVLWLAHELYGAAPEAFLLRIEGVAWDLARGLSEAAAGHLERAFQEMKAFIVSC